MFVEQNNWVRDFDGKIKLPIKRSAWLKVVDVVGGIGCFLIAMKAVQYLLF